MDSNLQTKNEYELKKKEKEEIAGTEARKKMIRKLLRWLLLLIVIGLLAWPIYGYFTKTATKQADLGEFFSAQSRDHIDIGASHPAYNSNPPTGGWHYASPTQTGIYDKEFSDEQLIHNLEHSHVWIAYKPDLATDQIEALADIAKSYGSKIIMTKRAANDTKIAIVAWEHLLKMDALDEARIRDFIKAYRGTAGPEKIQDSGFKDFRQK